MVARWGAENQNKLAREAKVGVATIARMKTADTSIGVDVLEKVADALGVQAWQLLCPTEAMGRDAPSPMALDLARQLDAIEDPELQRRAYAVASQVISFGVAPVAPAEPAPAPAPKPRRRVHS
ncbi:hypothetical protein 8P_034 [Pseudomonas phage 8P]|nr:hypothetical protein 8P_034 [Pseudomonas phage 8P]